MRFPTGLNFPVTKSGYSSHSCRECIYAFRKYRKIICVTTVNYLYFALLDHLR